MLEKLNRKLFNLGGFFVLTVVLTLFLACDIGLGQKVNTKDPAISKPSNTRDESFVQGSANCIELEVGNTEADISEVFMNVWYIDPDTGEEISEPLRFDAHQYPPTPPWCDDKKHLHKNGKWYTQLDTTGIPDGQIRARVTAKDTSGRSTTTTDITFFVKNLPPQIEMAIPTIKGRDFDSIDFILNEYLPEQDPIFVGFDLMGLATDNLGIKKGYPKIMIWPVSEDDDTGNPKPGKWAHWRSTLINGDRHGMTTKRFNWPMKELLRDLSDPTEWRLPIGIDESHRTLLPGNYRFRLWIKDTDGCTDACINGCINDDLHGRSNYYPHRTDNERGPDGTAEIPNTLAEQFMEIKYVNQELPIVTFMSVPSYFNGVGYINDSNHYVEGDYTVYVTITSTQEVLSGNVKGWITDSADVNPVFSSPEYNFIFDPTPNNVNRWKLTISKEQADAWYTQVSPTNPLKDEEGNEREEITLFVNARATNVNGDSSPPMSPRNFNFDKKPPIVIFDRPVTVPTAFASGKIKSGSYDIFYPLNDPLNPMPRWVTGLITVGGTNLDGFVLSRIYYHIGYLEDDSPTHGTTREDIYFQDIWKDTELHRSGIASDEYGGSWSGSLYAWNYQNNFNEWGRHKNCGGNCKDPVLHAKVQNLIQEASELIDFHDDHVNYSTVDKSRFYLPFYIKVVDTAGNFHVIQYKLCIDPDLDIPFVSISTPAPDSSGNTVIGGEVSLSGLATDNDWINSVQIRIKKYGTAEQLQHVNLVGDSNGAPFTDPNPPAGAVNTFKYYRPYIHNETNDIGNLIHWVYYSAADGKIGLPITGNPPIPVPQGDPGTIETKAGWFNAEKRNNDMVIGWFFNINTWGGLDPEAGLKMVPVRIEVRAVDSKEKGILTDRSVVGASTIMDVQFSSGVPTINNPIITKTGTQDRDYFEGITASGRFGINMAISDDEKLVNIRTSINGKRFDLLANQVNLSGNASNTSAGLSITSPESMVLTPGGSARDVSTLSIDVNTLIGNDLYTDLGYGKTGVITMEVEVHDNSTPTFITRTRYSIGVDNYYPTTAIGTATNASGNQFELSGLASDTGEGSGTLQDLARVLVYFEELTVSETGTYERTGIYRNPRGKRNGSVADGGFAVQSGENDTWYSSDGRGAIYNAAPNNTISGSWHLAPNMETYPNVRPQGSASVTWGQEFKNFPVLRQIDKGDTIGKIWESPHAMVIDSHELSQDLDGDGTLGEAWSGMVEKTWRAWMDTSKFKDGPWKVHYIVMDQAGNATHSTKDIFIENNKPLINWINLGTNIRGTTASNPWTDISDPGDFMKVRYSVEGTASGNRIITFTDTLDNPFRIRGNRLALRIETSKGNGNKHYTVSYVTPLPTISAEDMVRGEVYTIAAAGTTDWEKYGAVNNSNNTTFVASGPGEGTGTVVPYDIVRSSAPQVINQTTTEVIGANTVTYDSRLNDIVFSDFTSIADSQKVTAAGSTQGDILRPISKPANWPDGWNLSWPERLFIIKVYDTTVPGRAVEHQLAHAVLVALDIDNSDAKAPAINTADFGQKYKLRHSVSGETRAPNIDNNADRILAAVDNYNENIVMSTAATPVRQGYVQYKEHKASGNADISGQVIFTGKASDNQRIQNITVTIPGYDGGNGDGTAFTVATWNTSTYELTTSRAAMETNANEMWYFKIIDHSLSLDYGHTVNWEFGWDSSYVTNQVRTPQVQFRVNDFRSGTVTAGQSNLDVNIVPYISEVVTGLSGAFGSNPSAFARSSTGWYPVRESETITIRGFNLGGGNSTATTVTLNDTAITASNITKTALNAAIGTSAISGNIVVRVNNTVNSINNSTTKNAYFCTNASCTAAVKSSLTTGNCASGHPSAARTLGRIQYNWEQNNTNNNNLTNDRKLYVWSVGTILTISTEANDPVMSMNESGYRSLVMTNGTNGAAFRLFNNHPDIANAGTTMGSSVNRHINFGIALTQQTGTNTTANNWYVVASNMTGNQTNYAHLHARGASDALNSSSGSGSNKSRLKQLGTTNASPNRIMIPKLHARSSATAGTDYVTLSYGDGTASNQILLHYGSVAGTGTTATFAGGYRASDNDAYYQEVTSGTSTYRGSIYTASASLSNGQPVIAWFDERVGQERLLFSYGNSGSAYGANNTNGMNAARWNNRAVIVHGLNAGNHGLNAAGVNYAPTGAAGAHVDMAIDGADNVHLAYYDVGNGGLYYAHIPKSTIPETGANITTEVKPSSVTVVKVDTFLAAGTKIKISVRNEGTASAPKYVPYISYFHASFAETRNSIRVAWLATTDTPTAGRMVVRPGTDDSDLFTGNWEVMTIPAANIPLQGNFVCNGVPRTATNWSALTTGTGRLTGYNVGAETTETNRRINRTVLVSYMTRGIYEGAVLKHDIWGGP